MSELEELRARVEKLEAIVRRLAQALADSDFDFIPGEDGLGWSVIKPDLEELQRIATDVTGS